MERILREKEEEINKLRKELDYLKIVKKDSVMEEGEVEEERLNKARGSEERKRSSSVEKIVRDLKEGNKKKRKRKETGSGKMD